MGFYFCVFLLSSSLLFSQASSRAVNISSLWTLPQEGFPHFFRFFKDATTWDDAKVICGSFHAQLLTVENDERRDAVRAFLKELDVLDNVWLGLQRSSIEAPFVWTGGGQEPVVGDAFWQEAHPLEPERLCAAINPLYDFRWQTFPCYGPQLNSYICQLEVPDWARGKEGCLVNSLPSLTVTYLPEPGVIELMSDCGLSGTKRIACKGKENQGDLVKRLSCDHDDEGLGLTHMDTTTAIINQKIHRGHSSTPAGYTFHVTHTAATRHKRQSGGTSTSTDTSFIQQSEAKTFQDVEKPVKNEPEIAETPEHRIDVPETLNPLDTTTLVAEYGREDQIEASTISATERKEISEQTTWANVIRNLSMKGTKAFQTENSTLERISTANPHKQIDPIEMITLSTETDKKTTTKSQLESRPLQGSHRLTVKNWMQSFKDQFTEVPTSGKLAESTIVDYEEKTKKTVGEFTQDITFTQKGIDVTVLPKESPTSPPSNAEGKSHSPHSPLVQLRDQNAKTTSVFTTTIEVITSPNLLSMQEKSLVLINNEFNETENNVLLQDGGLELPDKEALVSDKFQDSAKNKVFAQSRKNAFGSEEKVDKTKTLPTEETTVAPILKTTETKEIIKVTEKEEYFNKHIPVLVEHIPFVNNTRENTKEGDISEIPTTTTIPKIIISENVEEKLISIQPSDAVPETNRPVIDETTIASVKGKEYSQANLEKETQGKNEGEVTEIIQTYEPKDTVTDTPTNTNKAIPTEQSTIDHHATCSQETPNEGVVNEELFIRNKENPSRESTRVGQTTDSAQFLKKGQIELPGVVTESDAQNANSPYIGLVSGDSFDKSTVNPIILSSEKTVSSDMLSKVDTIATEDQFFKQREFKESAAIATAFPMTAASRKDESQIFKFIQQKTLPFSGKDATTEGYKEKTTTALSSRPDITTEAFEVKTTSAFAKAEELNTKTTTAVFATGRGTITEKPRFKTTSTVFPVRLEATSEGFKVKATATFLVDPNATSVGFKMKTATAIPSGAITEEVPISEESSEEAQNPKRSPRGRLFQHSNPFSFYPYFLNKVLG